jgi:hypothetical protein
VPKRRESRLFLLHFEGGLPSWLYPFRRLREGLSRGVELEREPARERALRERLNAAYLQGVKDERERWTHVDEALGPHAVEAHGAAPLEAFRIATSRYDAADLIRESGLVPIGITVGAARVGYELAGKVGMLAPQGLGELEGEQFELAYRQRLDRFGVAAIAGVLRAFAAAHRAPGAVLLCFENVLAGETCHRRTFAAWWQERTGILVPELEPA